MANVKFNNVTKKFGQTIAVDNVSFDVKDGEFLVLVGPSGCGKTTTLRMLAGLESITSGTISIEDRVVNEVPPSQRDIAMVFQSYALYPHLTIFDNLAYGLRERTIKRWQSMFIGAFVAIAYLLLLTLFFLLDTIGSSIALFPSGLFLSSALLSLALTSIVYSQVNRSIRKLVIDTLAKFLPFIEEYRKQEASIQAQVREVAELLQIEEQLWKKPKQLSGGQRQRVALGRAIIRRPLAFLMDEPLSNLDAKLRASTRVELARLQRKLGISTIYVTHDQIEAMTLGHRIVIMNKGKVMQIGTPNEVYTRPQNQVVAGFIGSPAMNFITGKISNQDNALFFVTDFLQFEIHSSLTQTLESYANKEVILGIRPEHIDIVDSAIENQTISAKCGVLEPIGAETYVFVDLTPEKSITVKTEGIKTYEIDSRLNLSFRETDLHFFNTETLERIN